MGHILFITGSYLPSQCGVAHYTDCLRNHLAHKHIPSVVFTTHAIAESVQDETIQGVVSSWGFQCLLPLVQAIHQSDAALLHIQHAAGTYGFDRALFFLPLLLRLTGWKSPIVTTVHEYGWWEWQPRGIPSQWVEWLKITGQKRGWWDREDGFLLTQSNAILTTTHAIEQTVIERLPHLKNQIYRIPIAANVNVNHENISHCNRQQAQYWARQQCGWAEDSLIVAFFGFLHPVKGLETLLTAFQSIVVTHPQARLLLIGGVESLALPGEQATQYWNQLCTQIAQSNLKSVVYMTGFLEAKVVSTYLTAADIGVLPFNHGVTLKSGSLLTLLCHHLPVIVTDATPPDPQLSSTFLKRIPTRQSKPLMAALTELLENPNLRQQLATAGFAFSQQFSWSRIIDAHLAIYQSVGFSS